MNEVLCNSATWKKFSVSSEIALNTETSNYCNINYKKSKGNCSKKLPSRLAPLGTIDEQLQEGVHHQHYIVDQNLRRDHKVGAYVETLSLLFWKMNRS